ncbi:MAG: OB-fold domain-containing protein [Actinomycetota bacterium]|nr:OB-fold domain-containing protein [Actinomycetota bacterium]
MRGIISYGAYVPFNRLRREAIGAALGTSAGRGTRAVASFDEDSTTLAVEAGRLALRGAPDGAQPGVVLFATAAPAYQDKNNASAIHAALDLPVGAPAYDAVGSARSGFGVLDAAAHDRRTVLALVSEVRTGLAGGADEAQSGDAAAAFLVADDTVGPVLAEHVGGAHASSEFLDRWRTPGESHSKIWEERFSEAAYLPLVEDAVRRAYDSCGLTPSDVDRVVTAGLAARAVRGAAKFIGVAPEKYADPLTDTVGNAGTAHAGLVLASVLDTAGPGELIMVVSLADGVDVAFFRTTDAITSFEPASTVAHQIERGDDSLDYAKFLTWRRMLTREPPRRPDPDRPAAPPSRRGERWKFGFYGSQCTECGARHLPPARVCVKCEAVDRMEPVRLADVGGTIASYTIDRLAFSESPPMVGTVVDFDGGGRFQIEMTDVDPDAVAIGGRVGMTFRRLFTTDGIHDYFWKARPAIEG